MWHWECLPVSAVLLVKCHLAKREGTESRFFSLKSGMQCGNNYMKSRHATASFSLNKMLPEMHLINF